MKKIAIIGAGLSGLSIAHLLKNHADITIFEKARGVGGRMSTRRAEPYYFDHGAQYFKAKTSEFKAFIQPLIKNGEIERWYPKCLKLDGNLPTKQQTWHSTQPYYVGIPGMNSVAKHLSKGQNVYLNTKIESLDHVEKWQLTDSQGQQYRNFDWVISTAPPEQSLDIFPESFKYYSHIKTIKMQPCFTLMLGFEENLPLDFEAAHVENSDLSWIAVNSHKPGRNSPFTLVIHSSEKYAQTHIDTDQKAVLKHLMDVASSLTNHNLHQAKYQAIHLWRYANSNKVENKLTGIDPNLKLAVCGDWCHGDKVENAFSASLMLANEMKDRFL